MPEAEYLVQSASYAWVSHSCRQLSSLPMYSLDRWFSNQSYSNVQTHGTWLCLSQHVLQIPKGVYFITGAAGNILFLVPSATVLKTKSSDAGIVCQNPGGGGTPLYGLFRYMLRDRVWFLEALDPLIGYPFCLCWHSVPV